MESLKNRKRKSPKSSQIFEVSEKDLSPDCSQDEDAEPDAKIQKTQAADVSKSRSSSGGNLKMGEKLAAIKKTLRKTAEKKQDGTEGDQHVKAKKLLQVKETPMKNSTKKLKPKKVLKSAKKKQKKGTAAKGYKNATAEEKTIQADNAPCFKVHEIDTKVVEVTDDLVEDGEVSDSTQDKVDFAGCDNATQNSNLDSNIIEQPEILISFKNTLIAEIYKEKLLRYLERFVELNIVTKDETTMHINIDPALDPQEWHVVDVDFITDGMGRVFKSPSPNLKLDLTLCENSEVIASPKKKKKRGERKKNKKNKDLFILDATPTPEVQINQNPQYFTKFLIDDNKATETEDPSKPASNSTCFNCGKNHALKDCPDPKNMNKIHANRQKFMSSKSNKATTRYHVDEQQYGHLVPGKISSALRKALGLKHNQIPKFFYQMRTAGYPPGWLEEARIEQSNLSMFDIHGNDVKNANSKMLRGLDPDKVINYPGFNVPFEKGVKDEYKTYRVPPYSDDLHKERMIEFFEKQFSKELDDFKTQDMEIEEKPEIENDTEENEENLTLIDLEKEKEMLLNKLVNDDSNSRSSEGQKTESDQEKHTEVDIDSVEDSGTSIKLDLTTDSETIDRSEEIKESEKKELGNEVEPVESGAKQDIHQANENIEANTTVEEPLLTDSTNKTCESSSSTPTAKKIKDSTFGTPILKSASPYNTLPNQDNFSKDISPMINFENLPNSTGKYEKITGVLQKVRNTLKHLRHCKS